MKLDWIPQLFKDLIGRVVPGATILLAACIVRAGHFSAVRSMLTTFKDESSVALLLTGLVISYIVGYSLTQVWGMIFGKCFKTKLDQIEMEAKQERLEEHKQLQEALGYKSLSVAPEKLPELFVMHDHIRITIPQEANRLSKMQSEIRLCRALIVGIGILCAANLLFLFCEPTFTRIIIEIVMMVVVRSAWRREKNLHKYYSNGVCVIWLSLASLNQLFQLPK